MVQNKIKFKKSQVSISAQSSSIAPCVPFATRTYSATTAVGLMPTLLILLEGIENTKWPAGPHVESGISFDSTDL